MNERKIIVKFAQKSAFVLTFAIGVAAANIFAQTIDKTPIAPPEKIETIDVRQAAAADADLVNLAKNFSQAFQEANAEKMNALLADDFHYFTNVACDYKDCERGAVKEDYTNGVVEERQTRNFSVASVRLKYLQPIINSNDAAATDKKISFYCETTMSAKGKTYKYYSFINYSFAKYDGSWKISKIENQIIR